MSVRRRKIKERLDRLRKQDEQGVCWDALFGQIRAACDKWEGRPMDIDAFLFDAFGPLGPAKQPTNNNASTSGESRG